MHNFKSILNWAVIIEVRIQDTVGVAGTDICISGLRIKTQFLSCGLVLRLIGGWGVGKSVDSLFGSKVAHLYIYHKYLHICVV